MTLSKEETWNRLVEIGVVKGDMPPGLWILYGASLREADLNGANLSKANLGRANLMYAELRGADLSEASLTSATLYKTDLRGANLCSAFLTGAFLESANLSGANLSGANLERATLVSTNLEMTNLSGCHIFGVSVWKLRLNKDTKQSDLVISDIGEPVITVDNIEVAQFIYLLLNNKNLRNTINTITTKVVLILGRFTPERKVILDALREELRKHDLLPVLFDFEKPSNRNLTETVSTLAHLARFVIADITDAKSIPQELQRIVPSLPSLPVQPLILDSQYEYGMLKDLLDYPWVLTPHRYGSLEQLLASLEEKVIVPALTKGEAIEKRRAEIEQMMADEKQ